MKQQILKPTLAIRAAAALVCLSMLSTPVLADVCQKDGGPFRIKVVRKDYSHPYEFQICYSGEKKCRPLADKISYTWDVLSDLRNRELSQSRLPGDNKQSAALGILALFTLGLAQGDSDAVRMSPAAQDGSLPSGHVDTAEEVATAAEHKENAAVLANDFLSTNAACVDVPSIEKYKETLLKILETVPGTMITEDGSRVLVYPAAKVEIHYHHSPDFQSVD